VLPGVVARAIPVVLGVRELQAGGEFVPIGLLPLCAGFARNTCRTSAAFRRIDRVIADHLWQIPSTSRKA